MCRWQGGQRPTVRWISRRSKVFLFRLFLWRVLGMRWWRVSHCTVRPHSPQTPPSAPPFVWLTPIILPPPASSTRSQGEALAPLDDGAGEHVHRQIELLA